jgi:hypothetical protein
MIGLVKRNQCLRLQVAVVLVIVETAKARSVLNEVVLAIRIAVGLTALIVLSVMNVVHV